MCATEQGWKIGFVVRKSALLLLAIGLAPACGRTALDAGRTPAVDGGARMDARVPPDFAPAVGCAALQPLANGVLTSRHAARVLFAPDRSSLVLQVKGEGPSGSSVEDDLLLVRLPSGEVSPIISAIDSAEWLQPGATLLVSAVREGRSDLAVVGSDGSGVRTLVQGVCDHVAASDGSRVYAIHDCGGSKYGTMDVIDVASGASTRLKVGAGFGTLSPTSAAAVSPDGRWVAFLTSIVLDGGSPENLLVVGGADGRVETLASQPGAFDQGFVSDRLLLFRTDWYLPNGGIHGHVPGTGDTSYVVAAKRDPGLFGYQASPDGTWLLGATETTGAGGDLYAIRLDGAGELLLASDLLDFMMSEMARRVFAFSASGRVIYNRDLLGGVATVGLDGGTPTVLSDRASFLETPRLDRVALVEPKGPTPAASRLRLVDLESAADVFAYDSDGGTWAIGFPPSGRGLVFTESRSPSPNRLRYVSADQSVVLGEWQATHFWPDTSYHGTPPSTYPVDPTGCFTVFDTDLTPGPGTRLAVLPQ